MNFTFLTIAMTRTEFKHRVANAGALDFGNILNDALTLFKKSWLQGFLMQLIIFVIVLPFILLLYVPFIMMIISQSDAGEFNTYGMSDVFAGFSIIYMVFFGIGIIVISTVQTSLYMSFLRMLKKLDEGREVKTSELFYFIKGKYLGKIFLLMLITILIAIPAILFFYLPFLYLIIPISFFSVVFAFNPEWSLGDIISGGFQLGNKKWFLTFGLLFLSYVLLVIAITLSCGLGSLFLTPFMYHPLYQIYKNTVGFDNSTELDQIGRTDF